MPFSQIGHATRFGMAAGVEVVDTVGVAAVGVLSVLEPRDDSSCAGVSAEL